MPISKFQFRTGAVVRRTVSLNGTVIQSGAAAGTFVGDIRAVPASGVLSNVVLTDNVGNRFALDGIDIEAGAVATDFAVETFHNITVAADVDGIAVSRTLRVDVAFVGVIPTIISVPTLSSTTPIVGDELTCSTGTWADAPPPFATYGYQWQKDSVDIEAANLSTYTPVAGDDGHVLRCGVTAINAAGPSAVSYSANSSAVTTTPAGSAPTVISAPTISSGSPMVGVPITASPGVWANSPTSYVYQWQKATTDIAGATSAAYTPVAGDAGATLRCGVIATNGFGSSAISRSANTSAVAAASSTRIAGLGYTPSTANGDPYDVPEYVLPATFAAIDTATYPGALNVNSYANLEAAIDAANAANSGDGAHLAVGLDNAVGAYTLGSTKRYLSKSLIAFGSSKPSITCSSRVPQLFGRIHDVDICGFRIINAGYFFNMTQDTLPLTKSGTLSPWPHNSLGSSYFTAVRSGPAGAPAINFRMQRCGKLTPAGSGNVTSITALRQIEGTAYQFLPYWGGDDHPTIFQQVQLISGTITSATPTLICDAINAFTGTSGFSAVLSPNGLSVLILRAAKGYALEIKAVCTGTMTLGHVPIDGNILGGYEVQTPLDNTWGIDWRMLNCDLIDCNQGVGAILDVTKMGIHHFHHNDCPGTWTGFYLWVSRYTDSYAVNNRQYDCMTTRTTAPGRTSSRQPQGNGSELNMFLALGNEGAAVMNRRYQVNRRYWENNECENVESLNNIDSNQAATFCDARYSWDRSYAGGVSGGRVSHSWNKGTHVYGVQGGVDCQFFYGKERGAKYEHNLLDNCAAPYVNTTLYGSDAAMVVKANTPQLGMEEFGYRYSRWKNLSRGNPSIYSDASFNNVIEYCHFENWISPYRNGTSILTSAAWGCVFIYAQIGRVVIRHLLFKNCNALTSHLINLHAVDIFGASTDFHINNCYFQNDGSAEYPAYTGDVNLIRLNVASGMPADLSAYLNASQINHNYTLNAAGDVVGRAKIFVTNNSTSYDIRNPAVALATPRFNGIADTGLPVFV